MKPWAVIVLVLFCGCGITHRRVIKSIVTGSEMPKAPKWHVWVRRDKRRD